MSLAAGYWAIQNLDGMAIGYYACDLIYKGEVTHFYGTGTPDTLRDDVSLQIIEGKLARLFCWALRRRKLVLNLSEEAETRLIFPKCNLSQFRKVVFSLSEAWKELLEKADGLFMKERACPIPSQREDYWCIPGIDEKRHFL
jgi:hypothetical protein